MATNGMADETPTALAIGGRWRDASSGERFAVDDPATGEVIARVADGTEEDGLAAVAAAHEAQPLGRRERRASAPRSCAGPSS